MAGDFEHHLSSCSLCPRQCGADRLHGSVGQCGAGADLRIHHWMCHHGEEPPISGIHGSGTIFFSGCPLSCVYCQNHPWSQSRPIPGKKYTVNELSSLLMRIREAGCHNINFVTPEPWIPLIVPAVHLAKKRGLDIPVVWNTSGFISRTGFELIQDIVDIFLTDIRYKDPEEASRLSGQVSYFYHCRESALWMLQSAGHFMMKPGGIGKRGVIARILILPGMVQSAVSCLDFVARVMSTETYISLMSQFEPVYRDPDPPLPHRGVTRRELNEIREYAETLGLNYGWRQDIDSAPSELLGIHMKCTERVRELPFSNTSPPEKAKRSQADLHL